MASLLILKSVYNLSDEKLIEEHWEMNAYFQYFQVKSNNNGKNLVQRVIWFISEKELKKKGLKKF
jgi:hypothetical protein